MRFIVAYSWRLWRERAGKRANVRRTLYLGESNRSLENDAEDDEEVCAGNHHRNRDTQVGLVEIGPVFSGGRAAGGGNGDWRRWGAGTGQ